MAVDKMNIQYRIQAIDDFSKVHNRLQKQLSGIKKAFNDLPKSERIDVDVSESEAIQSLDRIGDKLKELSGRNLNVSVDTDDRLSELKAEINSLPNNTNLNINVAEQKAVDDINRVDERLDRLRNKTIWVRVKTFVSDWRQDMDRVADIGRDTAAILRNSFVSALTTLAPTGVMGIAEIAGALGAVGPIIGTIAGGIMGLGTSFGLAGIGALAFGSVAAGVLGKVFSVSEDVARLQEKLAKTTDVEKRAKILAEIAAIQGTLSKEQMKAYKSLTKMKDVWADIIKSVESGVVNTFTKAMQALSTTLDMLRPTFEASVDAANSLMDALNRNLKAEDVKAFFTFLGDEAGPMLERMGKTMGNFMMGVLNLMRAFGPLSVDMSEGLLGMSESFRKWTASLGESDKFKAFIAYVRENGPKLLGIFSGIVTGLVDMFTAFAPMSSDMLTGLQKLITKFQAWASTLSENQQFQAFIDYVKTNAPVFLDFIGQFVKFLVNLGEGFAKVGEFITPIIAEFLNFANGMMKTNEWIATLIAIITTLAGVFGTLLPIIMLVVKRFGFVTKAISTVWSWIGTKLLPIATKMWLYFQTKILPILARVGSFIMTKVVPAFGKFIGIIGRILPWVARIGLALGRLATGPIGWVIQAVIALGIIVYKNWDKIKSWTMDTFAKIGAFISNKWAQIKATFAIVGIIVQLAVRKFNEFKSAVQRKMDEVLDRIKSVWGNVMDFFGGINLREIGQNIIQGLIRGVKDMASSLVNSVKGAVGNAIEGAKNLLGINSPSRVFMQIGEFTGAGFVKGMDGMKRAVGKAGASMAQAAIPKAYQPAVNNAYSGGKVFRPNARNSGGSAQQQTQQEPTQITNYNTYQANIDPKNVREWNDIVEIFSVQTAEQFGGGRG